MINLESALLTGLVLLGGSLLGATAGEDDNNAEWNTSVTTSNVFYKVSDAFSRASQLKLNCTDVDNCDEPRNQKIICVIQVVAIVISFALFIFCYFKYRLQKQSIKWSKSQVVL